LHYLVLDDALLVGVVGGKWAVGKGRPGNLLNLDEIGPSNIPVELLLVTDCLFTADEL